jgi:glycosyltransferase involved in cell wall biosynthesis
MKIGINTFGCEHGRSGIGSYLISLFKNIDSKTKHEFILFGEEIDRYTYSEAFANSFEAVPISTKKPVLKLWHRIGILSFIKKQKFDIVLYPNPISFMPARFSVPSVALVQEIASRALAEKPFFKRAFIVRKLKKVHKIIAGSQYIRKDLIQLGIKDAKIEVIHNGIDHSLFYPHRELTGDTLVIKPFSIKRPYFIYVSRLQGEHKMHRELIDAFDLFKSKTKSEHRLVLSGSDGDKAERIHKAVAASAYAEDIFLTGHFPHENLPELYSCADASVFPSIAEGVGLPILEAMATGIPVLCAKAGSLPEFAGNSAIYFDAHNPVEIAENLERIVNDEKLRETMIESGLDWVKRFSWTKTADKTIEVLENLEA